MKLLKKIAIIVGLLLLTPFLLYFGFGAKSYIDGADLIVSKTEIPSKYIFLFRQDRKVIIDDKFNKFRRSWGGSPDIIEINDNVRTIIFREAAILKTDVDSIELHDDYVKVKGHMGIVSNDLEFTVNSEGTISSNSWDGG